MSKQYLAEISALKEKVRLLELENSDWTDRAEDVFLFASTAESINKISNENEIFETALEKISVMKDIPYCLFGYLKDGELFVTTEYASFTEVDKVAQFTISPQLYAQLDSEKFVLSDFNDEFGMKINFSDNGFNPDSFLSISFEDLNNNKRIFICVDKEPSDRLDNIKDTLVHSISLVQSRLENINLMAQLSDQNKALELNVANRTTDLQSEILIRKRTEEKLRKSEKRYRTMIERSNDFIWLIDANGNLIFFSENIENATGLKYNDWKGKSFYPLILEEDLPMVQDVFNKTLKGESVNYELRLENLPNGKKMLLEVHTAQFVSKEGVSEIISFAKDITGQRQYEIDLILARKNAEKADKLKSTFLAQMSHEIRTPINAIVSLGSLLQEDLESQIDEDQKVSFTLMHKAGLRIIRTVDLLLNLSEIQAGTYEMISNRFNIYSDVLVKIVANYKKLAKDKNIELKTSLMMEDAEIVADEYTVTQIFTQLIDNAIKYTDSGEISIKVYNSSEEKLCVEISDSGIGISPEYIDDIFDPFVQEEMGYTRKYEGSGIGLTLVKKYCDMNNATIEIDSEKGKGTTFKIIF